MLGLVDQIVAARKAPNYGPNFVCTDGRRKHLDDIHKQQTARAIKRYRDVLYGAGWLTTAEIEDRLGVNCTVANSFLRKLYKKGYLDKKPRDDGPYLKNRGWKWKWHETM